jgi:small subunit ribosomal protein S16
VIADSRAPRDGRYIDRLGMYNPNTNPATIELDFDRALEWLQKGAQPTETCRAILSLKGVLMKKHLLEGVKKNAFSEEEAEKRFDNWLKDKESKIEEDKERIQKGEEAEFKKRIEIESKIREVRAAEIAKKNAVLAEEAEKAAAPKSPETEESTQPEAAAEETTVQDVKETVENEEEKEVPAEEKAVTEEEKSDQETPPAEVKEEKSDQETPPAEVKEEKSDEETLPAEVKEEKSDEETPPAEVKEKKSDEEDPEKEQTNKKD